MTDNSLEDDVSQWLAGVAERDDLAIEAVWQRYYDRLVRLARTKLADSQRRVADEEDVVISAFHSFCRGAAEGRFPKLDDRHDLWRLLVTITARKASHQVRHAMQQKRGGGNLRGESVFPGGGNGDRQDGIAGVLGEEPTPELAAMTAEQCERLLESLGDESLRQLALWKLQGFSNEEIGEKMQCSLRTVERKLNRIRDLWSREEP